MREPRTRRWSAAARAGAVVALVALAAGPPSGAAPVAGTAVIVSSSGRALARGGSDTAFSLRLPDDAACPGDSANDNYRVNSYMVPVAVDPATLPYNGLGPVPPGYRTYADFRMPLYDVRGDSFVSSQTADAEGRGRPGPIVNIPAFDFAVYEPGDVPPGHYHVGLACTLLNEVTTVWDAEIVVVASADDPLGVRWEVVGAPAPSSGRGRGSVVAAVVVAVTALAVAAAVIRRRRPPSPSPIATSEAR